MAVLLHGFSPDSFEQLIRALALKVFGPGVTVFGNGPDGGREATFKGRVPYPAPESNCWDGYGVVQAKFKEKTETTAADQKWALEQIKKELAAFVKKRQKLPKPEYYVFCTNIELTSAASGGKDQANKLLCDSPLKFKDFAVWDANQIKAYIDIFEEIRRRFAQLLTSGDLIAELLSSAEQQKKNIPFMLQSYLDREFRSEKLARLDQAGDRADTPLSIARIFIDLPVSQEGTEKERPGTEILKELLHASSKKLDPTSLSEAYSSTHDLPGKTIPSTFILVGGPGSGKSTIGQCLAQVNRAALLSRVPELSLHIETRNSISDFRGRLEAAGQVWPGAPRYPLRVDLNRFAKRLGDQKVASLAQHLVESIRGDFQFVYEDLLQVLATLPIVLIFDGLDEVPVTSNREAMLATINNFLADARRQNCDLLLMATTRRQGYQGEFRDDQAVTWYLEPLSKKHAIRFTQLYAEARFGMSDQPRVQGLVEAMEAASRNPLIESLLVSPLQVTFMVTILAAQGEPSEGRWQLFKTYYDIIYSRELQKALPSFQGVLQGYRVLIDSLHFDIGFLLQLAGETGGKDGVGLPLESFNLLVAKKLREVEVDEAEQPVLIGGIYEAALSRLVFLTAATSGELTFEVRSLQEFMASQCLMGCPDQLRRDRLRTIAASPYWRNVWLFAAGQCFDDAQSRHLRDTIRSICVDLDIDEEDRVVSAARAGSWLALDLLESGVPARDRAASRQFISLSLNLLKAGDDDNEARGGVQGVGARLAALFSPQLEEIFCDGIDAALKCLPVERTMAAARLLFSLSKSGHQFASERVRQLFGREPQNAVEYSGALLSFDPSEDNWALFRGLEPHLSLAEVERVFKAYAIEREDRISFVTPEIRHGKVYRFTRLVNQNFNLGYVEIGSFARVYGGEIRRIGKNSQHPDWRFAQLAFEFSAEPSLPSLLSAVRFYSEYRNDLSLEVFKRVLPWLLAAIVDTCERVDEPSVILGGIENGDFGGPYIWKQAEVRWNSAGLKLDDFRYCSLPFGFDSRIAEVGLPYPASWSIVMSASDADAKEFLEVVKYARAVPPAWHQVLASQVQFLAGRYTSVVDEMLCDFYRGPALESGLYLVPSLDLSKFDGAISILFNSWSLSCLELGYTGFTDLEGRALSSWRAAFLEDNSLLGVLRCLAAAADRGSVVELPAAPLRALMANDSSQIRLAAIKLFLANPGVDEEMGLQVVPKVKELICPECEPQAIESLLNAIERGIKVGNRVEGLLLAILEVFHSRNLPKVNRCEALLRLALAQRTSGLEQRKLLDALELPLPPSHFSG